MSSIEGKADIRVARPLDRGAIRETVEGFLASCSATSCSWQGLFPDPLLAKQAVESHYEHELRSGSYHFGVRTYSIVQLLDEERAMTVPESELDKLDPTLRKYDPRNVDRPEFPRTTGDVSEIVDRGDRITVRGQREAVVYQVSEQRALGMPVWTVTYVYPDVDLDCAGKHDFKWLNESIAHDGDVYCRYGEEFLGEPRFEITGEAEHQADFSEFDGGASA